MKLQNKILCILQLPPPIHGSSIMNQYFIENKLINNCFLIKILPLNFTDKLSELGHFHIIKIIKMIFFLFKLSFQLIKFNPNLVYYTITPLGFAFYRDVLFICIIKLFNKKIIYHLHAKGILEKSKNIINKILYKLVFNHSFVIQPSSLLYKDIKNYCPENKVYFCHNAIGINNHIVKRKRKNKTITLLFLSNITKSKGVMILLSACNILKQDDIKFKCVFAGDWSNDIQPEEFWSYIEENNLQNYIKYVGPKYNREKSKIFFESDIFIFPTYNDIWGLVILEAMKFGLPVISTYEGAIPEIVIDGRTGFLVPQKDPDFLANRIDTLIKNAKLRKKMGKAGRERFLKKYTLEIWEKKMVNIFNTIINN